MIGGVARAEDYIEVVEAGSPAAVKTRLVVGKLTPKLAMAERRLLPAVREQDEETILAAAGTSCRHQIEHGAARAPLHPAQILRDALVR